MQRMITLRKSPRADNTIDLDEKTSKYIHTLQIAIYFIEMENISKHISYFYISEIGPQYFSLKGFHSLSQFSLFVQETNYTCYIFYQEWKIYPFYKHITYSLFPESVHSTFHYRKVIFPHPNSPHLSGPPHTQGERYHLFLYTFYLFPTTRQTIVCPHTVCNAHSHYLF